VFCLGGGVDRQESFFLDLLFQGAKQEDETHERERKKKQASQKKDI
jgi:hypothetical protein